MAVGGSVQSAAHLDERAVSRRERRGCEGDEVTAAGSDLSHANPTTDSLLKLLRIGHQAEVASYRLALSSSNGPLKLLGSVLKLAGSWSLLHEMVMRDRTIMHMRELHRLALVASRWRPYDAVKKHQNRGYEGAEE